MSSQRRRSMRGFHYSPLILVLILICSSQSIVYLDNEPHSNYVSENNCLYFQNIMSDYNYSNSVQYQYNITAQMHNQCIEDVQYPSTLIIYDDELVNASTDNQNWRYALEAGSYYNVSWQINWSSNVPVGTLVNFELHPTLDNCQVNCTESQAHSRNFTMALGLVDIAACYTIPSYTHDYIPNASQFNLTANLSNNCNQGSIHYPQAILNTTNQNISSIPEIGVSNVGESAYMIFNNTNTSATWVVDVQAINESIEFEISPACAVFSSSSAFPGSYIQSCDYSNLQSVSLVIDFQPYSESNQTGSEGQNQTNENEEIVGCTDSNATNYDPLANTDDGSCQFEENPSENQTDTTTPVEGCLDQNALNYNQDAQVDDGSCTYASVDTEMLEGLFVHMRFTWVSNGEAQEGEIVIELYPEEAPYHVNNFVALVEGGYYDDTIMHRIIQNFMIQGGDFTNRDGTGGHAVVWSGYCYGQPLETSEGCAQTLWNLPDEADNGLTHEPYVLSMAKTYRPNSGGSQFFVVSPGVYPSHLDGVHTVFGKVISGQSVIDSIEKVATSQYDRPIDAVTIEEAWLSGNTQVDNSADSAPPTPKEESIPGFQLSLGILAMCLSAVYVQRKQKFQESI